MSRLTGHVSVFALCVFAKQNGKSRLQQAQEDAEEVKDIMLDNLNKVDERSGKLGDLEDRADELLRKVGRQASQKSSLFILFCTALLPLIICNIPLVSDVMDLFRGYPKRDMSN